MRKGFYSPGTNMECKLCYTVVERTCEECRTIVKRKKDREWVLHFIKNDGEDLNKNIMHYANRKS